MFLYKPTSNKWHGFCEEYSSRMAPVGFTADRLQGLGPINTGFFEVLKMV